MANLSTYLLLWQDQNYYFQTVVMVLDFYGTKFYKFMLDGDFNTKNLEWLISDYIFQYELSNLVLLPTCCKNPMNYSYIDLIITNMPKSSKTTIKCIDLTVRSSQNCYIFWNESP